MNRINLITLGLVIIGGLNWGLVGFLDWDLVAALSGPGSVLSRIVYAVVGLAALWQLVPLVTMVRGESVGAVHNHSGH